jgi:hypothetical protein
MAGGHPAATPCHPTRRRSAAPSRQAHGQLILSLNVCFRVKQTRCHMHTHVTVTTASGATLREFSRYLARRLPPSAGNSPEAGGDAGAEPLGLAGPALAGS